MGINSFCEVLADQRIWRINEWRNNEGRPVTYFFVIATINAVQGKVLKLLLLLLAFIALHINNDDNNNNTTTQGL